MVLFKGFNGSRSDGDYIRDGKEAWEQARQILDQTDSWVQHDGKDVQRGCVCSRKFERVGKIWRLEAILDASPETVFDVLVTGVNQWPTWNPTIEECKTLHVLNENTDIAYSVGAPQVGGLVSSRDFVNLRHWKALNDDVMIAAACHTTHPDMPPCKKHVRAENKPASYVFKRVPGQPDKCHFLCFLNTDLKGWLPQILIDQAMSGVLMEYLKHLQIYLNDMKSQNRTLPHNDSAISCRSESDESTSDSSDYKDASDSEFDDASQDVFLTPNEAATPIAPLVQPICS